MYGLLHACFGGVFGNDGAVVIDAVRYFGPAVVETGLDEVDFIAAAWTVFVRPQGTGLGVFDESLGIAVTVGPDDGHDVGGVDKGVVGRYASVVLDAVNFTGMVAQGLGVGHVSTVANGKIEVAVVVEDHACAKVHPRTGIGRALEQELLVGQSVLL